MSSDLEKKEKYCNKQCKNCLKNKDNKILKKVIIKQIHVLSTIPASVLVK